MIQAMVCAFVPMSGAGTSVSGLMSRLNSVARKDTGGPVIHLYREVNGELALGVFEDFVQPGIQAKMLRDDLELLKSVFVRVGALARRRCVYTAARTL